MKERTFRFFSVGGRRAVFGYLAAGLTVALLLFQVVVPILAAPPTSPYRPGETLNPTCAPTDPNCTVNPPIVGAGTSTQLAFWDSSSSIASNPALTYTSSTGVFAVDATSSFLGGGLAVGTTTVSSLFTVASATPVLSVFSDGVIGLRGVNYVFPGSQGGSGAALTNDGTGTLSWSSLSAAGGWTDDGTVVRLTSSTDRVGIGTSTPGASLDVVGSIQNIANPSAPLTRAGSVSFAGIGFTYDIAVSGRYAYITTYTDPAQVIVADISKPSAPTKIGSVTLNAGENFTHGIAVAGRYVYVVGWGAPGKVVVIDVSNPAAPTRVGSVTLGTGENNPYAIEVSGRYAYVSTYTSPANVVVIDVSNPAAPTRVGAVTLNAGENNAQIVVAGRYVYASTFTNPANVVIVDVSNPAAPTRVGGVMLSAGESNAQIAVAGRYAYVSTWTVPAQLIVVDVSNPAAPTRVSSMTFSSGENSTLSIAVAGRYAYMSTDGVPGNILVADVSNPSSPVRVGSISLLGVSAGQAVAVSGRYAYAVTYNSPGDLIVIDVTGSETTSLMAHSAEVGGLQVRNNAVVEGSLSVRGGFTVGTNGLFSQGPLSAMGRSAGATSSALDIRNVDGTSLLFVRDDGLVGIGTTQPSSTFHVVGTSTFAGGQIQIPSGSVGSPALAFSAEPTTGIYRPVANRLSISIAGSQNFIFTSTQLAITAGSAGAPALTETATANSGMWWPTGTSLAFSTNANERLRINSSGNVGIGTSTPTATLHVVGTSTIIQNSASFTGDVFMIKNTAGVSQFSVAPDSATGVTIRQTVNLLTNTLTWNGWQSINGTGASGGALTFTTAASNERMRIDSSGRVGIGTSTPSALFTVGSSTDILAVASSGLIGLRGVDYSFPLAQGGAGTALTNDGAGNLSWGTTGNVTGSGTSTYLALWNGTSSLGANSDITYGSGGVLTVGGDAVWTITGRNSGASPYSIAGGGVRLCASGSGACAAKAAFAAANDAQKALTVTAAAAQTANIQEWQSSAGVPLVAVGANGSLSVGTTTAWGLFNVGTSTPMLVVSSSTGNVGIGVSNPSTKLAVLGTASATIYHAGAGSVSAPSFAFAADTNTGLYRSAAGTMTFVAAGTGAFDLTNSGMFMSVPIIANSINGARVSATGGSLTVPTLIPYRGVTTSGLGGDAAGTVALLAGGTNVINVASSGRVGIGTTVPSSTLHVSAVTSTTFSLANTITDGKRYDFRVGAVASGTLDLFDFASSTTRFAIDKDGRVGIGTQNPGARLHVNGGVIADSLSLSSSSIAILTAQNGHQGYVNFSGGIGTGNGGTPTIRLSQSGNLMNIGSVKAGETLLTRGGTFAAPVAYAVGTQPRGVAIGDVNGDAKMDIVASNFSSSTVSILLGNGNGTFAAEVTYAVGNGPRNVNVADFNGDGKLDVAVANITADTVSVLMNNGNGTFAAAVDYGVYTPTMGGDPLGEAVGDLNGDGRADIVVALMGGPGSSVSVLMNKGDGTFATFVTYDTGGSEPVDVTIADLNGDGKADIAATNRLSGTVAVLMNNGSGTFAAPVTYTAGYLAYPIAAADLNGDGSADLAIANQGSSTISIHLNNGNGTFAAATSYGVGTTPEGIALADLNGDGKPDIVNTNNGDHSVSTFINNGDGTFATSTIYSLLAAGNFPLDIAAADLNGDGKADFVSSNSGTANVSVLLNTAQTLFFAQASTGNVGIGTAAPSSTLYVSAATSTTFSLANTIAGGKRYDFRVGAVASGTLDLFDFASSTTRFALDRDGLVGIGTTVPSSTLHVVGTSQFTATSTFGTNVGIGIATPARQLHVYGAGQTTANLTDSGNRGGTLYLQDSAVFANNGGAILFGAGQGYFTAIKSLLTDGTSSTVGDLAFSTRHGVASTTLEERMRITSAGRIGIGTSTPDANARVTIIGPTSSTLPTTAATIMVLGSSDGTTSGSSIRGRGSITGGLADVGEYAIVEGDAATYVAGDLLSISSAAETYRKSQGAYDPLLAGVVTETAGLIAGGGDGAITYDDRGRPTNRVIIALAGRVPTNVSEENGPIRAGDPLTASSEPGVAMRATAPGRIVGFALENFPRAGASSSSLPLTDRTIVMMVNPGFSLGALDERGEIIGADPELGGNIGAAFVSAVRFALARLGVTLRDGVATLTEVFADRVTAKRLCLDDLCIGKEELQGLLDSAAIVPSVPPPAPSPAVEPTPAPTSTDAIPPADPAPVPAADPAATEPAPVSDPVPPPAEPALVTDPVPPAEEPAPAEPPLPEAPPPPDAPVAPIAE